MSAEQGRVLLSQLWRRTSVVTQVLHSGASFLLMAGMARLAPTHAFALASAFFLLVTLGSSLNVYVLSAAWLRLEGPEAARRLAQFALLLSTASALMFALFWLGYRGWAFGAASLREWLLVGVAAFSYLNFFAQRRQLLLGGEFVRVTLADGIRALLILGAGAATLWSDGVLEFERFLLIFIGAHLLGMLPMMARRSPTAGTPKLSLRSRFAQTLSPASVVRRGDWLSVGSGIANVLFSQSASLLAPMLVSPTEYATLRAYELFLFPVFFMAQVLDPICLRRYRALPQQQPVRALLIGLTGPSLLIFAPLALICAAAWFSPAFAGLLQTLIAPEYREAFWLMGVVLMLSGLIAINAPLRWYSTAQADGRFLLMGTALGIVVSLTALFTLTHIYAGAWAVLASKIAYEAALLIVGGLGVTLFWKNRS